MTNRSYQRLHPRWIYVVTLAVAIAGAVAITATAKRLELLLGRSLAGDVTLYVTGSLYFTWKLTELVVLTWACRRWGECTIAPPRSSPPGAPPELVFRTPLSFTRCIIVRLEDVTDRVITPHGVRLFVARASMRLPGKPDAPWGIARIFDALLIPCAPGAETDEVLALLDTPWAERERQAHAPSDASASPRPPIT